MNEQIAIQKKLQDSFTEMRVRNPAFSMRAFAKRLDLNPSAVSEILKGKRRVSKKLAQRMLLRVCADGKEAQKILDLFDSQQISDDSRNHSVVPVDQFQMIAGWQHFAIHSLVETKNFKSEPQWIARRLGLRESEVIDALLRMERVGLIEWDRKKKKILQSRPQYATPQDVASSALRASHLQDLEMARRKIEEIAVELREFTSVTMGIDSKKIPVAKKMIREFRDKLAGYLETGQQDQVYKMCLHFFPLSQMEP